MFSPWTRYFIRIASVNSAVKWVPGGDNLVKGVQCYELFGGIALKNHAFSYSSSYSVPSIAFEMPLFYDFTTLSFFTLPHPFIPNSHETSSEAARIAPPFVNDFYQLSIQLFHSSVTSSLNCLFRLTSSGCRKQVKPPGITAISVLVLDNLASEHIPN